MNINPIKIELRETDKQQLEFVVFHFVHRRIENLKIYIIIKFFFFRFLFSHMAPKKDTKEASASAKKKDTPTAAAAAATATASAKNQLVATQPAPK